MAMSKLEKVCRAMCSHEGRLDPDVMVFSSPRGTGQFSAYTLAGLQYVMPTDIEPAWMKYKGFGEAF